MRPTSLTARLVVTAVALVAVAVLLIGTATTVSMRSSLYDRLDQELGQSVRGYVAMATAPRPGDGAGFPGGFGDDDGPGQRNQPPDTLIATPDAATPEGYLTGIGANKQLSSGALELLAALPVSPGGRDQRLQASDVSVPGAGDYRVVALRVENGDGDTETVVIGRPLEELNDTLASLIWLEVLLGVVGAAAAGGVGVWIVRRQLAPLREVAATAHEVARLPLDEGDVDLSPRVSDPDEQTEVGQVGAALNALLAHVERSLAARHESEQQVRRFVADASHELRTPLATIRGYADLSALSPDDTDLLRTAMAKVGEESVRMGSLVDDLLLLARLDAGRPLAHEPVDLTRLLLEAVADARVLGPRHTWQLALPPDVIDVDGDEQRLHQVVTNLLTNARRHTPEGSTVTVSARHSEPGWVEIVVADDGPGFPPGFDPFERFSRGDSARTRSAGGAGLGLSIVAAIVAAQAGSARIVDDAVVVRLPLAG